MAEQAQNLDTGIDQGMGMGMGQDPNQGQQFMKGMDIDAVKFELATLRQQFDKVKVNVKDKAVVVDDHLHASPYPYVLGAFGLGSSPAGSS